MKILYINEFLNSSFGARIHGINLIKELRNSGVSVYTVPSRFTEEDIKHKSEAIQKIKNILPLAINENLIFAKKTFRNFIWFKKAYKIIRKEKPDCILIRPGLYDLLPVYLKNFFKIPIVLEVNAPLYSERKIFYQLHPPGQQYPEMLLRD